jgi:hypothetical protein
MLILSLPTADSCALCLDSVRCSNPGEESLHLLISQQAHCHLLATHTALLCFTSLISHIGVHNNNIIETYNQEYMAWNGLPLNDPAQ